MFYGDLILTGQDIGSEVCVAPTAQQADSRTGAKEWRCSGDGPCWRRASRWSGDRKSTRLNSSHGYISYAVFCFTKNKTLKPTSSVASSSGRDASRFEYQKHLFRIQLVNQKEISAEHIATPIVITIVNTTTSSQK